MVMVMVILLFCRWAAVRERAIAGPFTVDSLQYISRSLIQHDDWITTMQVYERVVESLDTEAASDQHQGDRLLQGQYNEIEVRCVREEGWYALVQFGNVSIVVVVVGGDGGASAPGLLCCSFWNCGRVVDTIRKSCVCMRVCTVTFCVAIMLPFPFLFVNRPHVKKCVLFCCPVPEQLRSQLAAITFRCSQAVEEPRDEEVHMSPPPLVSFAKEMQMLCRHHKPPVRVP